MRHKFFFEELQKTAELFLPLFFSQLTYAISIFLSTLIIANVGKEALAALALGSCVYASSCVFFYGIFVSISIFVARNVSMKNEEGIGLFLSHGFVLAFFCSIPFMLILRLAPLVFRLTEQEPHIIELTETYLKALSWSVLPWLCLVVIEQFLIAISLAKIVFWISLIQVGLEIAFNYGFVHGKWGFPQCGISGLGYGFTTVFIFALIVTGAFVYHSDFFKPYKKFILFRKVDCQCLKSLLSIGIPIGSSNVIESLLFLAVVLMMGKIGFNELAGQQIIRQYLELTVIVGLSLSQATTVRVALAAGNKKKSSINASIIASLSIGLCLMLVVAFIYIFFGREIISLDINVHTTENAFLVSYIERLFLIVAIFQIFDCLRLICMGSLRGLKDTKFPLYITIFIFWLIGFPVAYLLGFVLNLGGIGVWCGLLFGMVIGTVMLLRRIYLIGLLEDFS